MKNRTQAPPNEAIREWAFFILKNKLLFFVTPCLKQHILFSFSLTLILSIASNLSAQQEYPPPAINYANPDPCPTAQVVASSTVRYKTFASFYLKLSPVSYATEVIVWIKSKKTGFSTQYATSKMELFVPQLVPDDDYTVTVWNGAPEMRI